MEKMINKNYKHDINYAFELSRFVFRLLGFWSYTHAKSCFPETLERVTVVLACYILLICEVVPAIFYMAIIQKEARGMLKAVAIVIFTLMAMAKYGQLLFSRNQVSNYLAQVENNWRNVADLHDRDVMINKARIGRRLLIICAIFMYSTGVSFRTIIPLSRGKIVTEQNTTIKHLPCSNYFVLFDVQLSPAYEIVFLMQFFSGFVKCTVTTAVCGLASLFVIHIWAQLEILMVLMNCEREDMNNNESFVLIFSYIFALASIIFNFMFCYIGDLFKECCQQVGTVCYMIEWNRLPPKKASCLYRSQCLDTP